MPKGKPARKPGGKKSGPRSRGGKKKGKPRAPDDGIVRKPEDAPESQIKPMEVNESGDKRNKHARSRYFQKYKLEKAVRKQARILRRRKEAAELGADAPAKLEPKTIESLRPVEDTYVSSDDEEVEGDERDDEFAEFFQDGVEPRMLITAESDPCRRTRAFIDELLRLFPNSEYFRRQHYSMRDITQFAVNRGYTDVMLIGDSGGGQKRRPYSMVVQHLPQGPTFCFRISSVLLHEELDKPAERSEHYPELILKNFQTLLGRRLKRQIEALFPQTRDFKGRGVVTFHNQRDFVFVRSHRYVFDGMDKCRLQELGPRFTLRLRYLQAGLFDPDLGDFEWFRKKKEMDRERRRAHL
eukprot:TRINITY_DN8845_c1_g1_i1.p1 TRINITY_DN8845_c1_g1~~TRINITY_DN8845_c1_g1_i1.p1  ORF type:complete len:354 (+),score=64.71 TRINITY_DN8845_c1_g1_i1:76-1137(+)